MIPPPGPWAPIVTQHLVSGTTTDRYNETTPTFTDKPQRVYAEFPGNAQEVESPAGDTVLADLVLLVPASLAVSPTDEWTCSDGLRYSANGPPARYHHPHTGTAITQINLRRIS